VDFFREFADALLAFSRDHLYVAPFLLLFIEEAGIRLPAPGARGGVGRSFDLLAEANL